MYHSIRFGLNSSWRDTWVDWHLIPSNRPDISFPGVKTNFVEIPGNEIPIDLSDYLAGGPVYNGRTGSLEFICYVDSIGEAETIKEDVKNFIQGKRLQMILEDDPNYYYVGRFVLGTFESTAGYPTVKLTYNLDPFKYKLWVNGEDRVVWNTFNFETDYDWDILRDIEGPGLDLQKNIEIPSRGAPITISAKLTEASSVEPYVIFCKFGNGPVYTLNKVNEVVDIGTIYSYFDNKTTLTISGTGKATFMFREMSL